jgi:hypothetical protein
MRDLRWRGFLPVPLLWPGRQRKGWLRQSLLVTAAALATICGAAQASTTIAQKIAVPAYFVPGIPGTLWTPLTSSTPAVGIAVANVLNGPDFEAKTPYQSAIQAAHNAGIKVLGYVDTGYYGTTGLTTRLGLSGT